MYQIRDYGLVWFCLMNKNYFACLLNQKMLIFFCGVTEDVFFLFFWSVWKFISFFVWTIQTCELFLTGVTENFVVLSVHQENIIRFFLGFCKLEAPDWCSYRLIYILLLPLYSFVPVDFTNTKDISIWWAGKWNWGGGGGLNFTWVDFNDGPQLEYKP